VYCFARVYTVNEGHVTYPSCWGAEGSVHDPRRQHARVSPARHGAGACESGGAGGTNTSSRGTYSFTGLAAGTYCVMEMSVPPTPGGWRAVGGTGEYTVTIGPNGARTGVNFWLYRMPG
jgi:hypothetical protein